MRFGLALSSLVGLASSAIVWDGRVNEWSTSAELSNWSWSNQVGPYQYYIHGPSPVSSYVNLSPSYKNPADSGSNQGLKITLDSTAYWNGQNMRRTELIPQKSPPSALTTGKLFYHFSISRKAENAPSLYREHQIAFFESHFTELKSGANSGQPGPDNTLRWAVSGQTKWSTVWEADVWYNFAYEIDFSANSVALWSSTGAAPLALTVPAVSVSTSSNGADWHVGVLELPNGNADTNEDFFFSGVYIENGSITTSVAGPGGVVVNPPVSSTTTVTPPTTTAIRTTTRIATTTTRVATSTRTSIVQTTRVSTPVASTFTTRTTTRTTTDVVAPTPTGAAAPNWGQCGGNGWTGPKTCGAGWVCKVTNEWYSQCLQG